MKQSITTILIALTISLVGNAQTLKPADILAIEQVCLQWNQLTDDKDTDGYLSLWTDDARLINPFGDFKGKEAIRAFQTEYVTNGAAVGKRHMATNIVVSGLEKGKARASMDLMLVEVVEPAFIVATLRIESELVKVGKDWKLAAVTLSLDEGFVKRMQKSEVTAGR